MTRLQRTQFAVLCWVVDVRIKDRHTKCPLFYGAMLECGVWYHYFYYTSNWWCAKDVHLSLPPPLLTFHCGANRFNVVELRNRKWLQKRFSVASSSCYFRTRMKHALWNGFKLIKEVINRQKKLYKIICRPESIKARSIYLTSQYPLALSLLGHIILNNTDHRFT